MCEAYWEHLRQLAQNNIIWRKRTTRVNFRSRQTLYIYRCKISLILSKHSLRKQTDFRLLLRFSAAQSNRRKIRLFSQASQSTDTWNLDNCQYIDSAPSPAQKVLKTLRIRQNLFKFLLLGKTIISYWYLLNVRIHIFFRNIRLWNFSLIRICMEIINFTEQ